MKAAHLARKPLAGTVASNVLKHGVGAINIDGTRISSNGDHLVKEVPIVRASKLTGDGRLGAAAGMFNPGSSFIATNSPLGRWPANLILVHKPGCQKVNPEAWGCVDSCPVSKMSGFEEEGGASRFFKQYQKVISMTLSSELVGYLTRMISPPDKPFLYVEDISQESFWTDLALKPDASLGALILVGTPTEAQSRELMRVLLPGAHLILVAPDAEPTGHTGACRIEDAGFEIRDAILLADEVKGLHYVPKSNRQEREAGCQHLEGKSGAEATDREEGSAGLDSPRAGAGRTAAHIKNFHPTLKPVELMSKLLQDVPKDRGAVLDPFLGSGSTAIAAAISGYSAIGIEREREYLEIADARVRHWVHQTPEVRYAGVEIQSDVHVPVPPPPKLSFEDTFGFGGEDD